MRNKAIHGGERKVKGMEQNGMERSGSENARHGNSWNGSEEDEKGKGWVSTENPIKRELKQNPNQTPRILKRKTFQRKIPLKGN